MAVDVTTPLQATDSHEPARDTPEPSGYTLNPCP
jgi:hypothetical protein